MEYYPLPFEFGDKSLARLATVHSDLQMVAELALDRSPYDFTIIHGWRGEEVQNALFESGASTKPWPLSKHNAHDAEGQPESDAIDFGPWVSGKIPWQDTHIFAIIAGCFFAAADELDVLIRYGGDWDTDGSTKDQSLMDWGHVEIVL